MQKEQYTKSKSLDDDTSFQFSFKSFFKGLFVISLPHFTLILIFLIYVIVGSAILKEIEANHSEGFKIIDKQSSFETFSTTKSNVEDKKSISNLEMHRKIEKIKINFIDAKNNFFSFHKKISNTVYILKKYEEQLFVNHNDFLKESNKIIKQTFNSSEIGQSSGMNKKFTDNTDLEGVKFIAELYDKQKKNMSVVSIFKSIAKHLLDYKTQLKTSLNKSLKTLVESYIKKQNSIKQKYSDLILDQEQMLKKSQESLDLIPLESLTIAEEDIDEEVNDKSDDSEPINNKENSDTMSYVKQKNNDWKFSTSLYFIGSLLTTIGIGDVYPQTTLGKIFTMFYIIIGVPLTLILLTDLGSIFTRCLKFWHAFISILYEEGYFDRFLQFLKRMQPFSKSNKDKNSSKKKGNKKSSNDKENEENDGEEEDEEQSTFQVLCEIGWNCIESNDDLFDISLTFLFSLVFVYLSFGAIISSRVTNWSLFNGYYFWLTSLTKIGLGDLVINDQKFILFSCGYILFGVAFFDLTINCIQEKLRNLIVQYGQHIINEVVKFFNNLGYNWSNEAVNFDLAIASTYKMTRKPNTKEESNGPTDQEKAELSKSYHAQKSRHDKIHAHKKHHNYYDSNDDVMKLDKSTQITTLLCSKMKLEKSMSLETLYTPPAPTSVASVKPNSYKNDFSNKISSYKSQEALEASLKEEEGEDGSKYDLKKNINQSEKEIKDEKLDEKTSYKTTTSTDTSSSSTISNEADENDISSIRLRRSSRFSSSTNTVNSTSNPAPATAPASTTSSVASRYTPLASTTSFSRTYKSNRFS